MEIDGLSLSKALKGDKKPVHGHLFFEMGYTRGVANKDWKCITVPAGQSCGLARFP